MFNEWFNSLQQFANTATSAPYDPLWKLANNLGGAVTLIGAVCAAILAAWRFTKGRWRTAFVATLSTIGTTALAWLFLSAAYATRTDNNDWQFAKSINSPTAYKLFIERHPLSPHAEEAQQLAAPPSPAVLAAQTRKPAPAAPAAYHPRPKSIAQETKQATSEPSPPPGTLKTFIVGDATIWLLSVDPSNLALHDGMTITVTLGMRICCNKKLRVWVEPVIPDSKDGNIWSGFNNCSYTYSPSYPEASSEKLTRSMTAKGTCENAHLTAFRFTVTNNPHDPNAMQSYELPLKDFIAVNP